MLIDKLANMCYNNNSKRQENKNKNPLVKSIPQNADKVKLNFHLTKSAVKSKIKIWR